MLQGLFLPEKMLDNVRNYIFPKTNMLQYNIIIPKRNALKEVIL